MTSPLSPPDELLAKRAQQHSTLRRALLLTAGCILVVAGLSLGPVPFLPGFPLTMLGVVLLASASDRVRRLVNWGDAKLPTKIRALLRRMTRKQQSSSPEAILAKDEEPTQQPKQTANLPAMCAILGVASILLSPIVLGVLPGALGLRTAIDARRMGFRHAYIPLGLALSAIGLTLSIVAAIMWGGTLATILLSREVEREAVVWRGRDVAEFSVTLQDDSRFNFAQFRTTHPSHRVVLLVWSSAFDPCRESVANAMHAAAGVTDVVVVGIAPEDTRETGEAFLGADAQGCLTAYGAQPLPPPLNTTGARPTLIVIGTDGKIECVLLGVRGVEELKRTFKGEHAFSPRASP